ncbi:MULTISPECIES: putative quinol monooxygenase [Arthrobacter]|uniref:Antibiotic biosynthesis monooxygenase n=1 Tax=Arthrobacter terricola TaxID=2547396 RepID=A0A4R5KYS1_9MICC|nr:MULTISPECIES: antibiotic biosynthesis monooxygenase [Arthrobacter]MBT8159624.1 antibiotic biosynthesis monooxygenase [Arthrobacter sp. GN70]TDG01262.1 antibiotic biosynthesis monooxygenase [Arthrobacter terricola]
MTEVHLSGQLLCVDMDEVAAVVRHLPGHVALTRAEAGCISFNVSRTGNPLVWQVDERFRDADTFYAHQDRAASSDWGRATARIERRYTVEGL